MDILVFKILTDVCFYMAMFMPLFLSGPLWVRVLLFLALASWCVWLLVCWKKRNMEERAHDSLMTEARLLLAAAVSSGFPWERRSGEDGVSRFLQPSWFSGSSF